jgi:hypothetical protein
MSDMALAAVASKQAQTQNLMQIAMVKKQHEMEMSLINMLTEAVENAPRPDGTGTVVNKSA